MYECLNCGTLADNKYTIEVGVNTEEPGGMYDYEFVLCPTCEKKRQGGEGDVIKEKAEERARKLIREEAGK